MTTQRNINTQALPHAARSCVLAVRAWLMSTGMQPRFALNVGATLSALISPKTGLNFNYGPGDPTTRMFVAGAPSA